MIDSSDSPAPEIPREIQEDSVIVSTQDYIEGGKCIEISLHLNNDTVGLDQTLRRVLFYEVLEFTEGDKNKAARMLGLSLKTIYNRLGHQDWVQYVVLPE